MNGRFTSFQKFNFEDGSLEVVQKSAVDTPVSASATTFESGDSPFIFDVNAELGRNAKQFAVINDGPGNLTVSISNDGIAFGDEHIMKNEEVYSIDDINIHSIRITWVENSAYRILAL